MRSRLGAALLFVGSLTAAVLYPEPTPTAAQKKKEEPKPPSGKADPAKQKEAAVAMLKKADLSSAVVVETDNFLIATSFPEAKAKALGAAMEKVVPIARKALQFEPKEEAWRGKLIVFVLPESREFKSFIRSVVVRDPSGGAYYDLRADDPFVVDPVDVPVKATEADQQAAVASTVATALLKARGGTASMPGWLQDGFGRVTAMRAEGISSARYTKYRAAARPLVGVGKGAKAVPIGEVWGEMRTGNSDVLANSLVEYMAYGPGAMNFVRLVYGFRPNENGDSPATPQALEAAGWKDLAVLEKAWQKWASGK